MKKSIVILFLSLIGLGAAEAQQNPQYTQYMLNTIVVNPAFAGSRGVFSVNALHRSQWIGLDGAPITQSLGIDTPLSEQLGLGFSVVNDDIGSGTVQNTGFNAAFSYLLTISQDARLVFGLNAGGQFLSVDYTKLKNFGEEIDLVNIENDFSPRIGVGTYFYTHDYFVGFSIPNLLVTDVFDNDSSDLLKEERMNLYLISGAYFDLSSNLALRPGILLKSLKGSPFQVDVSANLLVNEKFSFGAAYRLNTAVSALFGFQVSESFMVGMAYDIETTTLGSTDFDDGSFEILLRYEFLNNNNRSRFINKFF